VDVVGTILVVDDKVELAENIVEILEVAGHRAEMASSAEAALERIALGGIRALITDFRLPGLTGTELISELRRSGSDMPVVVMSAYADAAIVERAEAAGALDVMLKPLDLGYLRQLAASFGEVVDVLIVDDNVELAENLADALRARGLSSLIGNSARAALAVRRQVKVALVDFRLPDRNGVHVAVRLLARNPKIQLIFVSAFADEARAAAEGQLADVSCLAKPVETAALVRWASGVLM
jgi:DNA-binding NtrC family response regulator